MQLKKLLLFFIATVSSGLHAMGQRPTNIPYDNDPDRLIDSPATFIFYVVMPLAILVFYIIWKRKKNAERKNMKPPEKKQFITSITSIGKVTHDTLIITTEKPQGYDYKPGQATDISINLDGWKDEKRPFTFTSLPEDPHLEFIIKTYPSHDSTTDKLLELKEGDELILHEVFGTISYRGEGLFIAGGAGITPFISILRSLKKKNLPAHNALIYANKTRADIILEDELENLLDDSVIHVLSEEKQDGFEYGLVDKTLLEKHIENTDQFYYVCGPKPMMEAVEKDLKKLGVNKNNIVKEGW